MKSERQLDDYLAAIANMKVGNRPIYPSKVIENIKDRTDYVPVGLEMQEELNGNIVAVAQELGIPFENSDVALLTATMTQVTLENLRVNTNLSNGIPTDTFLAITGPGGAGKDTVYDNAVEILNEHGVKILRPAKYTTRDSSRPGASVYRYMNDVTDLHDAIGDVPITPDEAKRTSETFGIDVKDKITLEQLLTIETKINKGQVNMAEWNIEVHPDEESTILEMIYRSGKGWYATDGKDILEAFDEGDIVALTGNPENLARMITWVESARPKTNSIMTYVLPPHPAQFVSAARTLSRDGIDQPTNQLLAATRQTGEVGLFVDLLKAGKLKPSNVVVLENRELLSDPEISGKVETLAGKQLASSLLNIKT